MNDHLQQIFGASTERPASSRPSISPRVRGGPPLEGAPKLENDLAMSDAPKLERLLPSRPEAITDHPAPPLSTVRRIDGAHRATDASLVDPTPAPEQVEQGAARSAVSHDMNSTAPYRLACTRLKKSYRKANVEIPVLKDVSLGVRQGEFLAIVGQSGSGKSTLLHLLGTLDSPDGGEIRFDGQRIDNLPGAARNTLRNEYFGMIFQFYHLLPELTTLENVLTPLMIRETVWGYLRRRKEYRRAAVELLETVGLGHRLTHKPRELSGGEMQRAAIARALVTSPEVLLADEPTGNLDRDSGGEILDLLDSLNQRRNLTIVMVTHDPAIADRADRIVRLTDGRIEAA